MPGLGDEFRAAREARHLSPSDVSEQIHIRSVYLQSIEDEDWSAIAAPVYVRGFIRTYARFLGLDAERAVAGFNATLGEAAAPKAHEPAAMRLAAGRRGPSPWVWIATAIAVLLVGFVGYNYFELQRSDKPATSAIAVQDPSPSAAPASASPVHAPVAAGPGAATAPTGASNAGASKVTPASATRTLEVRLTQASWLLVRIDGAAAVEGIFPAGTRKAFHGRRADVRAGNAGGVDLTVNGKELGTMGHTGDVVEHSYKLAAEE